MAGINYNVMTVMNVGAIINGLTLSKDMNNPTPIGHNNIWMVSDDPRGWSWPNNDAGNITLTAQPQDNISFYASSTSDNSDYSVFVYRLTGGGPVLNPSEVNVTTLSGAAQGQAPGGAPAKNVPQSFVSCDVKVSQHGTAQNFWIWVAVYQTGSDGETQNLLGYVNWDPTVICQ